VEVVSQTIKVEGGRSEVITNKISRARRLNVHLIQRPCYSSKFKELENWRNWSYYIVEKI